MSPQSDSQSNQLLSAWLGEKRMNQGGRKFQRGTLAFPL
jgi:hypothetical protein